MTDSNGYTCFVCGGHYCNGTETRIEIVRIERGEHGSKTVRWEDAVCDGCLQEHLGIELQKGADHDR